MNSIPWRQGYPLSVAFGRTSPGKPGSITIGDSARTGRLSLVLRLGVVSALKAKTNGLVTPDNSYFTFFIASISLSCQLN